MTRADRVFSHRVVDPAVSLLSVVVIVVSGVHAFVRACIHAWQ